MDIHDSCPTPPFLERFNICLSVRRRCLTGFSVAGNTCSYRCLSHPQTPSPCPYTALLRKYPSLTSLNRTHESPPHGAVHHIRATGPASFQRYCRLGSTKKPIAQTEFELMVQLGAVRPSGSKWADTFIFLSVLFLTITPQLSYHQHSLSSLSQPSDLGGGLCSSCMPAAA